MNIKRDLPIRPSEMGVLIFTEKQNTPITPLMLSNFFKISKPSVTFMINSLIKKQFLLKTPSPIDGRSYTISITDKGRELVECTHREYFIGIELLKTKLGDTDFNQLIELLEKANNILSEED
jgi:DNA-binding MarR family transcriptional regulator